MAATKTYDASQVTVAVAGLVLKGYADGEFLRIEPEADDFDDVAGTDGEVSRSKTNDTRATATIILMQTSESNAALDALSKADRNLPGGAGIGPFYVRDRSGYSVHTASACWIRRRPNVTFDRTPTTREWVVRLADYESFEGGN